MDVLWKPPMDYEPECKMLEKNFVTCLHEKSQLDIDVPMACNVERILWFSVDCPTRYNKFTSHEGLKSVYSKWQAGDYESSSY